MIDIIHLNKSFSGKQALKDVNLTFRRGRIYGIMGENGAGKSTLFRCMMHLERYEGEIRKDEGLSVGYLDDTPFFYSFVTGLEYIQFCLRARRQTIDQQEIESLNALFALPLDRYATNYSLGMKKRLMIMTLMLQKNDVVIMDEPFNGLDLEGTIILKQWIREMRMAGKTAIISSHITAALTDVCDEIVYMHQGTIVANYSGMTTEEIEQDITEKYLRLQRREGE